MDIDINQKKIAVGDKYKIFIGGQLAYTAAAELFRLLTVIHLIDPTGTRILTINKKFAWFKASYDITLGGNDILEFRTKSFWKRHFQCQYGSDLFDIYGHRGRKYSVFKNNSQIAWWRKQAVTWFEGDNYKIAVERDSNIELVIAFCLIIDNHTSNDKGDNSMTINLGSIGPQARAFDKTWQPKS